MQRIDNHLVGIARGSVLLFSDVEDGGAMWTGSGPRLVRKRVDFEAAFRVAPEVFATLEMWDVDSSGNQRGDISTVDITRDGFDLVFKTWGDTRVARVRAGWLAIGAVNHPDNWQL